MNTPMLAINAPSNLCLLQGSLKNNNPKIIEPMIISGIEIEIK